MNDAEEKMEKVTRSLMRACEEMSETYGKSVDVAVESATAFSKGCDEWRRNFGDFIQEEIARALNAGKTMMAAKSIKEVVDLQAQFAKDCFEHWMAATGKLSEISARLSQAATTPVARQAGDAIGKAIQKQDRAA